MLPDQDLGARPMPTGADSFPAHGPNSLASIQMRAAGRALDWAVLLIAYLAIVFIGLVVVGGGDAPNGRQIAVLGAVWFVLSTAYETLCVAWRGKTLGKLATGTRVARLSDGRTPYWWQAAIRVALPGVVEIVPTPFLFVFVGVIYLGAAWDPMRRGLHDKAAGTVVVNAH